jgi:hypothetical protein
VSPGALVARWGSGLRTFSARRPAPGDAAFAIASLLLIDDGRAAVRVPAGPERTGHGIAGIRERVAVYGGLLQTGRLPGGGWRVHVRFRTGAARKHSVISVLLVDDQPSRTSSPPS